MPRRRRTPSAKTAALLASRVADVAQKRTRSGGTPWSRSIPASSSIAAKVRSSASSASTPVRSTSCPRRTTRESRRATSSCPSSRTVPMSSLIELVPQSMAATVAPGLLIRSLCRRLLDARPRRPPVAEPVEDLVAERVDPAPHGERLAGEDVEALDPVGHAAGADAVDLGDVEPGPLPHLGAELEVALVRRAVGRGELLVGAETLLHLLHHVGALEGADARGRAWAGEVERRGERRAVGQPRLGRHHVGVAARAPVPDRVDAAGRPLELGVDRCLVGGVDPVLGCVGARGGLVAHCFVPSTRSTGSWSGGGGLPASSIDSQADVHQALGTVLITSSGSLSEACASSGLPSGPITSNPASPGIR